jgi:hypothetical protein
MYASREYAVEKKEELKKRLIELYKIHKPQVYLVCADAQISRNTWTNLMMGDEEFRRAIEACDEEDIDQIEKNVVTESKSPKWVGVGLAVLARRRREKWGENVSVLHSFDLSGTQMPVTDPTRKAPKQAGIEEAEYTDTPDLEGKGR